MELGLVVKSLSPGYLESKIYDLENLCLIEEGEQWRANAHQMKKIRNLVYATLAGVATLFYAYKAKELRPLFVAAPISILSGITCALMVQLHKRAIAYKEHLEIWKKSINPSN